VSDKDGWRQIYFYSPRDQSIGRLENLSIGQSLKAGLDYGIYNSFRKIGHNLVIEGSQDYVSIDLNTGNATLLLSTIEFEFPKSRRNGGSILNGSNCPDAPFRQATISLVSMQQS